MISYFSVSSGYIVFLLLGYVFGVISNIVCRKIWIATYRKKVKPSWRDLPPRHVIVDGVWKPVNRKKIKPNIFPHRPIPCSICGTDLTQTKLRETQLQGAISRERPIK